MRERTIQATLSADEWHLISTLREMPPSPLKTRVGTLLDELLVFIQNPTCAEMQADGVPCDHVDAECAQCVHVASMIDSMDRVAGLAEPRRRS